MSSEQSFMTELVRRIKEARLELGYSQRDMARMLDITQPTYQNIETGGKHTTPYKVAIILKVLNIQLPEVMPRKVAIMGDDDQLGAETDTETTKWPAHNNI